MHCTDALQKGWQAKVVASNGIFLIEGVMKFCRGKLSRRKKKEIVRSFTKGGGASMSNQKNKIHVIINGGTNLSLVLSGGVSILQSFHSGCSVPMARSRMHDQNILKLESFATNVSR